MRLDNLARLSATLVHGDENGVREALHRSLDVGIPVEALREVVFTSYLFDGYPTALEGFRQLVLVAGEPIPPPMDVDYNSASIALWRDRGERLCRTIYGAQYDKLTDMVQQFAPELADAMLVEGYGKVLSRDNLDPKVRELVVVAILAAKNRPRQLLSHCLGALRLGATEKELRRVLAASAEDSPPECKARAELVLDDAIRRFVKP